MRSEFHKKEIGDVAQKFIEKIIKLKNKKAKILALSGDLGAGKTTLTKELMNKFGIKEKVISPTFVIMKIYNIDVKSKYYHFFKKVIHIDAYRLESAEELLKIGWDDIQKDKDNLIIIEWPEKVVKCLGKDTFWVKLEHAKEETRTFEF